MQDLDLEAIILVYLCIYITPYSVFLLITSLAAISGWKRTQLQKGTTPEPSPSRHRFLVIVPAYDEGASIAKTVLSCKALQYPASLFDVLVIADNCSDDTASQAREAGARVLERLDANKKSKGYAIEYLIETLMQEGEFDRLDALVIVDADSTVHRALLERFAQELERGRDWIQCYDCVGNADQSWRTRLMAYGFSLINGVTLSGLEPWAQCRSTWQWNVYLDQRFAMCALDCQRLDRGSGVLLVSPNRRWADRLHPRRRSLCHDAHQGRDSLRKSKTTVGIRP